MANESVMNERRELLGRMAVGSAVLLVAGAGTACAAPPPQAAETNPMLPGDGEWLSKLHGAHRQFFDVTGWNDGFGLGYATNWTSSMKSTYSVDNDAVCAVIGLRHFGIAPAFSDAVWAKYKLGEFFKITDPKTKKPSVRNFAYNETEGDFMLAGTSLSPQIANGTVVTVCNLATTVISGLAAKAAGVNMTAEQAYEEFKAGLQPGCYLVPTGVLAVNRAQAAGKCSYCYAG